MERWGSFVLVAARRADHGLEHRGEERGKVVNKTVRTTQ